MEVKSQNENFDEKHTDSRGSEAATRLYHRQSGNSESSCAQLKRHSNSEAEAAQQLGRLQEPYCQLHGDAEAKHLVEGLELVRLDRRLVLVKVAERVLRGVVVGVVVRIDGLGFEASDGVELLDRRRTKPGKSTEDRPLDFRNLCILHGVHERVLRVRGVVLQLLRGVFLPERRNFVKVHLQIVRHLLATSAFSAFS